MGLFGIFTYKMVFAMSFNGLKIWTVLIFSCVTLRLCAQNANPNVKVVGAMRNVMWKGQLGGTIQLDTIQNKQKLYGLGPVENLAGEILIIDGKAYKSSVISESAMKVEETYAVKAPFFGYAKVEKWKKVNLPDSLRQLERFLDQITQKQPRPFFFKLSGLVKMAKIHVVNLPPGSKVSSPAEAHRGQVSYHLESEKASLVGFFSTTHQAVLTHHDTFLHLHLITKDKKKMGHLDDLSFDARKMKLFLPF
jgi:acetolactate decarboxylase